MLRKVFKTGNSLVVSLPKEALELLGISKGSNVSIYLDRGNRQIILSPVEAPVAAAGVDEEFARQVTEFIEQYRTTLEALANA